MARVAEGVLPLELARRLQLGEQELVQPLPHPGPLPIFKAPVAGRARAEAELERQMPPGDSRVQDEQNPCSASRSGKRLRPGKRKRRSTFGSKGSIRSQGESETIHGATAHRQPFSA